MADLIGFAVGHLNLALKIEVVERVVPIVEISPLPQAPEIILGIIDLRGQILPVFNLRKRFSLPERDRKLSDQLLIAHTRQRSVALLVDCVIGIVACPNETVIPSVKILPDLPYVEGIMRLDGGLILIHDLNTFLSLEESSVLEEALDVVDGTRNERI